MSKDNQEKMTKEQYQQVEKLISFHNRDVPFFYDEGVCEVSYVPIKDGELRVFHHKPENSFSKRPILFVPGFGTSPWSWRLFSTPLYQKCEYYFLETREKGSSKMNRRRHVKFSIDQTAKDIGEVIKYLELDKKDFILMGASYCGGVVLQGLVKKYYSAPTVIVFDPLPSFKNHKKLARFLTLFPPFMLSALKYIIAHFVLLGMKNKTQRERVFDYLKSANAWKWRRAGKDNIHYDIMNSLKEINEEVFNFHGPVDKFHPDLIFEQMSAEMPNGRYFYMNAEEQFRELLAGIIAYEFTIITAKQKVPDSLAIFEFILKRK
ncbi:MAG: alpha/beta fold hydrolase [Candidatus Thorarchaeota archaeon]